MEADLRGYSPPLSLWKLVELHVSPHERDEIKSMLGPGVVDETLELHEELEAFLGIWRDCRDNSEKSEEYMKTQRLPEPPGMRDRLVQEIKFFIDNVKEKAQEQGRDENGMLNKYNQNIINYATCGDSRASSVDPLMMRPSSVMGRDGKETPSLRYGSPASDSGFGGGKSSGVSSSTYSTLSEDVEAMADKLNIIKLDEIVTHLRSHLAEEKEWLVQDLKFLQECIEDENESSVTITEQLHEPTIGELREERLKLEKDMLSDVFLHQKPLSKGLTNLKPTSAKKRTSVLPTNGPLKAIHTTAPDGIVLAGNVPDSVIAKAQQKLADHEMNIDNSSAYILKVDTSDVLDSRSTSLSSHHATLPVRPHGSANRPSSARRFRSMVMSNRSCDDG